MRWRWRRRTSFCETRLLNRTAFIAELAAVSRLKDEVRQGLTIGLKVSSSSSRIFLETGLHMILAVNIHKYKYMDMDWLCYYYQYFCLL